MEPDPEVELGRILVQRGVVRPDHVEECQRLRQEMAARAELPVPGLGLLLVQKGYLARRRSAWAVTLPVLILVMVALALVAVILSDRMRERNSLRRAETLASVRASLAEIAPCLYVASTNPAAIVRQAEQALARIEESLAFAPDFAEGHFELGRACEILGDYDRAEQAWRRVIALNPQPDDPHYRLGLLLVERAVLAGEETSDAVRMFEEARTELQAAVASGTLHDIDRAVAEGALAYARRDHESCRLTTNDALRRLGDTLGSERLWWLHAIASSDPERDMDLSRAIEIRPHYAVAYYGRALVALRERGGEDYAEDYLHRALRLSPRMAEAHRARAHLHRRLGRIDAAVADLREAYRLACPALRARIERELAELDQRP